MVRAIVPFSKERKLHDIAFSKNRERQLWIAGLAAHLLPMVQTEPARAFAADIYRRLDRVKFGNPSEADIGAALHFLQNVQILTSKKAKHPNTNSDIKVYELTDRGALLLAILPRTNIFLTE